MIALYWDHFMWFWGLTNGAEWPYLLWSGSGSDVLRIALIASIFSGSERLVRQRALHHRELREMHERHHSEIMGKTELDCQGEDLREP
jgi:hypothetical protein